MKQEARRARDWAHRAGVRVRPAGELPPPVAEAFRSAGSPWPAPLTLGRYWEGHEPARRWQPWLCGIPLVYMILAQDGEVIYIGSTSDLPERLICRRRIVHFASWMAWPMPTRDDAYVAEDQWLRAYRPITNHAHHASLPAGANRGSIWPIPSDIVPVRVVDYTTCCVRHRPARKHYVRPVQHSPELWPCPLGRD